MSFCFTSQLHNFTFFCCIFSLLKVPYQFPVRCQINKGSRVVTPFVRSFLDAVDTLDVTSMPLWPLMGGYWMWSSHTWADPSWIMCPETQRVRFSSIGMSYGEFMEMTSVEHMWIPKNINVLFFFPDSLSWFLGWKHICHHDMALLCWDFEGSFSRTRPASPSAG